MMLTRTRGTAPFLTRALTPLTGMVLGLLVGAVMWALTIVGVVAFLEWLKAWPL